MNTKILKPIFAEGYGPYNDTFRIKAVAYAELVGYKQAAKLAGCSEGAVRNWTKVYASGALHSTIERT